jgi:hypothetical protein
MAENKVPVRPATRGPIYDILDGERDYQNDTFWYENAPPLATFADLMLAYAEKMKAEAEAGDTFKAQKRIREIGALAVRAAEYHGIWAREHHVPPTAFVTAAVNKRV